MSGPGLDLIEPDPKFADCNSNYQEAKYVFFGVPFDATVSHRSGASGAPKAIRKETYNFETYLMDLDLELENIKMVDIGDISLKNDLEGQAKMISDVEQLTGFILDQGKVPLMMGGDHSVTEGAANAFMERFQRKGGVVITLDAHLDFRDQYLDNPHSHASVSRRIFERWGKNSVSIIGARSGCREEVEDAKRLGLRFVTSKQLIETGVHEVLDQWDSAFSIRDRPIYLSIDIDALDPSYAPGTGTPEPWGISTFELLYVIEELHRNMLAMDIVEISPLNESFITPGLGGKFFRQFIGYKERRVQNPTWA